MQIKQIHGKNAFNSFTKTRTACRGVVIDNGKLLLSYETVTDQWMLPGGGLEGNESHSQCCAREVAEETGFTVKPYECYLELWEFYEEYKYITKFFLCTVEGHCERKLTRRELAVKMEPKWLPLEQAIAIFAKHEAYDGIDEERRGIYQREWEALKALPVCLDA